MQLPQANQTESRPDSTVRITAGSTNHPSGSSTTCALRTGSKVVRQELTHRMAISILDPYRLRQFVAVAERLNITHAAAQLHLTQQAVSSTLKTLERDLGTTLFERSGRTIALTSAGKILLKGAKPLLHASAALAMKTSASVHDTREDLLIGHTPTITPEEVFDLITPLRNFHPKAGITARQLLPGEMSSAIRSGAIDVGLQRDFSSPEGLTRSTISYTPLRVALSSSHRHAGRSSIPLLELAEDTIILPSTPEPDSYSEYLLAVCRMAGFEPSTNVSPIQGMPLTAGLTDLNQFAFVTAAPGSLNRGLTTVLSLESTPMAPIQALWLPHTSSNLQEALFRDSLAYRTISDAVQQLTN